MSQRDQLDGQRPTQMVAVCVVETTHAVREAGIDDDGDRALPAAPEVSAVPFTREE